MGNFESLRIDVGLELDGTGNPDATFNKAYNWTSTKLVEKIKEEEEALTN